MLSKVVNPNISARSAGFFFALLLLGISSDLFAATFTVTNNNDSGAGTFRQAINDANTNAGSHIIQFKIPLAGTKTIKPSTPLPGISNVVFIDATTQTNYVNSPLIELNGSLAGTNNVPGLYLLASNCTVRGLSIIAFSGDGIRVEGVGGNTIQGNYIGVRTNGTTALGNGNSSIPLAGITILSPNNQIGGVNSSNRNIISGNNFYGIHLINSGAASNAIQGNYIGTDFSGSTRLPNLTNGITVVSASSNLIGGSAPGAGNLISGNGQAGVYLLNDADNNVIQGNFIGVNAAGTGAISNGSDGITLSANVGYPNNNLIGGTNTAARNLISGNGSVAANLGRGVYISGTYSTGNRVTGNYIGVSSNGLVSIPNGAAGVDLDNAAGNTIGGPAAGERNLISGNGLAGVKIGNTATASGNVVQFNWIGLDATGTNAIPNARYGIFVLRASTNTIGPGNIISGNTNSGVLLTSNAVANIVQGNYIGTDFSGLRQLGNSQNGIQIESPGNTIGGTDAASRNVISGNTINGIYLIGLTASNNLIQGNYLGTDLTGTNALKNATAGIGIYNAPANQIGGTNPAARNLISGNYTNGIYLIGLAASNNLIQGNYIGTEKTGKIALANGLAFASTNAGYANAGGINISSGANSNLIGGTSPGSGNLVSGNWGDGITIGDSGSSSNLIQGNLIGTQSDGVSPLGNAEHAIDIRPNGGANYNTIGGVTPGAGNVVAYTRSPLGGGYDGVRVRDGNYGTVIRGNSIFGNGTANNALGIDLGDNGVNNIIGCNNGTSSGGNRLQNYPLLTGTTNKAGLMLIQGTLNSISNSTYLVDFYANTTIDLSGYGEGQFYLGSTNVTTDGTCNGTFTFTCPATNIAGAYVTATATDPNNNTSEFSAAFTVNSPTISVQPQNQIASPSSNATFTVTAAGTGTLYYQWRTNGTPRPGATAATLNLTGVTLANATNYDVVITNAYGTITSAVATLTVTAGPVISQSPTSRTNLAGSSTTFAVAVTGAAPLAYQWRTNGAPIPGATGTNLVLLNLTTNDALAYTVVITNLYGSATSAVANLTVVLPPSITQSPVTHTNYVGSNDVFTVTATGTAPLSYQWRTNGVTKLGATNAALNLPSLTLADTAGYDVIVTNPYGSATSAVANLTVLALAPIVLQSPASQTVISGNNATLAVVVTGALPLRYQWRTNGISQPGETNATTTLFNATTNDSRNYDVVITNVYGSVTSAVAAVTVFNYAPALLTLVTNGPATNRINLVFFAEGYQTNQLPQFQTDAAQAARYLLTTPPYNEYSNYFNAYAVAVASTDSGSDHYTPAVSLKNTYFNSSYDSSGIDRLITIPPNSYDASAANGNGKIQTLLTNAALYVNQPWAAALLPQITANNRLLVLLVNDSTYGGSGQPPDQNGSLALAVSSLGNDSFSGTSAFDIVAHESGHVFADLADEYATAYPGFTPVEKANATAQTNRSAVPWNAWISSDTPVPTPLGTGFDSFVGLFAGAQYQASGWYRPRSDCKMNHIGEPFCEVCSEAIVLAINRKVRTIESSAPGANVPALTNSAPVAFSVSRLQPSTHNLAVQWLTNGAPVPGATNPTFSLLPLNLPNGTYTLRARVTDGTALVRTDLANSLSNSAAWSLNVALTRLQLLSSVWLTNGAFTFSITGDAPFGYVVQASTNLITWTPLVTNAPLTNGGFTFTNAPGFPRRFFRTVTGP